MNLNSFRVGLDGKMRLCARLLTRKHRGYQKGAFGQSLEKRRARLEKEQEAPENVSVGEEVAQLAEDKRNEESERMAGIQSLVQPSDTSSSDSS